MTEPYTYSQKMTMLVDAVSSLQFTGDRAFRMAYRGLKNI
jgi:hypothetical protein